MKVIYLLHKFPKISETFILNEMLEMQKKGVALEIFAIENPGEDRVHPHVQQLPPVRYFPKASSWQKITAHLYFIAKRPLRYLAAWCLALVSGEGLRKNLLLELHSARLVDQKCADHIHAHFGDAAADMAMLAHLVTGVPFTFTTHSYDLFRFPPDNYKLKSRLALKHVSISEYNKRFAIDTFGVDASHIVIVHCGVDFTRLPARAFAANGDNLLVSIARLHKDKGLDVLIRACDSLKKQGVAFECRIVGEGPDRPALEALIAELGVGDRVKLLGNRTQAEVFELLQKAKIKVLSSRLEGIPVSLMEAMALKVPVISTRICGIPELIEDGKSGFLVPAEDAAKLAEKIRVLLEDGGLRVTFAKNGYKKVSEEFDLKKETDKLLKLWSQEGA